MNVGDILSIGREVFRSEKEALKATSDGLDDSFGKAVRKIVDCRGKIICTGIGKSGLIARKIAATLSSTGTPAIFLHPVESLHGDLGLVTEGDIAFILSNSGTSDELERLVPVLRGRKVEIIAVTGRPQSYLGKAASLVLTIHIKHEACPLGLAPMASTTAQLAMGDALAAALIRLRGFSSEDFAYSHPGGALGKRLTLKVADLMHGGADNPIVAAGTAMREALVVMTEKAMGAISIIRPDQVLAGIITDGDLRRALQKYDGILDMEVDQVMTPNPISLGPDFKAYEALRLMEDRPSQIYVLPVVDKDRKVIGILRLHDLVRAGF